MRFFEIGDYCDLSSLYLRLLKEGHEVKVYISKSLCHDTLAGLVTRTLTGAKNLRGFVKRGIRA